MNTTVIQPTVVFCYTFWLDVLYSVFENWANSVCLKRLQSHNGLFCLNHPLSFLFFFWVEIILRSDFLLASLQWNMQMKIAYRHSWADLDTYCDICCFVMGIIFTFLFHHIKTLFSDCLDVFLSYDSERKVLFMILMLEGLIIHSFFFLESWKFIGF